MNVEEIGKLAIGGQLLSETQVQERRQNWLARGGAEDDGFGFAQWLVEQHDLTDFQAGALQAGIPGPYMLGPYRLSFRLATGRLGDLFHAEHAEFGQPVSLKIFPAAISRDEKLLARFGREARVGLEVDHLHVVKTYQVGKVGPVPFIALEELYGESLEQRLARNGRLPYAVACQLIQQAAQGLAYLHAEDIVHRDIRPANLWITAHGVVKIMEFGAARDALSFVDDMDGDEDDPTNGPGSTAVGHYDYMSAEQAENPRAANAASDLYSLGCTLYHCLTGQVPFPDTNPVRQMLRHARATPQPLFDFDQKIPEAVQDIVSNLLAKRPEDRYESADDLNQALANVVAPKPIPELDPVNREFLEWLVTRQSDDISEYEPEFQEFLEFVSDARFKAVMEGRPTF
ncbi:MAG: serine/threonine-protein kinase [Planctomycetota bacterium]